MASATTWPLPALLTDQAPRNAGTGCGKPVDGPIDADVAVSVGAVEDVTRGSVPAGGATVVDSVVGVLVMVPDATVVAMDDPAGGVVVGGTPSPFPKPSVMVATRASAAAAPTR